MSKSIRREIVIVVVVVVVVFCLDVFFFVSIFKDDV